MKTLIRTSIVDSLIRKVGLPQHQAATFLEKTLEAIIFSLANHDNVKILGFGSFSVRQKRKRLGRNPKTREKAIISPRHVVLFKASPFLKRKVQRQPANQEKSA